MNRLKELRAENNMTQFDLAAVLNVQRPVISKYESGRIPLTDDSLSILSDFFSASIDYILCRSNIKKSPTPDSAGNIPEEAKEIITLYDKAPPELRKAALAVLRSSEHAPKDQDDPKEDQ